MKEFVKKKAVIVMDSAGLPNYMTMFYMEPGTYEPEDVPELFKIRNKIVPAVLVSQFTNTMIKGVPASLPYQQPKHTISYDEAAAAIQSLSIYCMKQRNWGTQSAVIQTTAATRRMSRKAA